MWVALVFVQVSRLEEILSRCGRCWRSAGLAVLLVGLCGVAWGQAATADEPASRTKAEQSGGKDQPSKDQPSPPVGPPAQIEGFRQARFGMTEEQVRQAIRKDFPGAAAKLTSAVHPSEKTTVLSLSVVDLPPHTGNP